MFVGASNLLEKRVISNFYKKPIGIIIIILLTMIDYKKQFVFVHVPKTGGSSIERTLDPSVETETDKTKDILNTSLDGKHLTWLQIYKQNKNLDNFFKFAFVRNPYDRMVSLYKWYQFVHDDLRLISFEKWLKGKQKAIEDPKRLAFLTQYNFLSIDNEINLDFIGRFENLEKDFAIVCKHIIGFNKPLLHCNNNFKNNRQPYQYYHTNYTKKIIEKYYYKDLEYFNYEF